jgi:hypothetical protein
MNSTVRRQGSIFGMFNLLVSGSGWADDRDTILSGRAFEHTVNDLVARFKPKGKYDFAALLQLPALFLEESSPAKNQIARVGRILSARESGRDIALEYAYDQSVPPLTNATIESLAQELDIGEWELTRTHWAIKDIDLFHVLLRHAQPRRQKPRVFTLSEPEIIEPELVSAMMPFDASFADVYGTLKAASEDAGLRFRRADDIWENPAVIQDVVSLIDRSKAVICDCTGRNPNVFYEIGIAHTLGREVILITQADSDIPFDLRHLRFLKYLNNREGRSELRGLLAKRLGDL